MCIGTKGTTPGVEQGKELSLLVKEQCSPKSHKVQADADGPKSVTYTCLDWASVGPWLVSVGDNTRTRLMTSVLRRAHEESWEGLC